MLDIFSIEFIKQLNPHLATFFLSSVPLGESKLSIPIALSVYNLSAAETLFLAIMSNIIVSAILIYSLTYFTEISKKFPKVNNFLNWLFERTRKEFFHKHRLLGDIALVLLVAIPLPLTGFWTASIAAWLLGIPKHRALIYISVGIIASAHIVLFMSIGVINGVRLL